MTVRVAYSSVNYKDALAATGKGRILRRPSCIGGIDFSGTVVASTDPRFKKGDAVLTASGEHVGVSNDGGYAAYARVKGDWITKVPQGLSLWEAMAYGTAGYTAGIAVVRMEHNGLKPANGPVIVNGATGGVGSIAIAMFAKLGYHVVALTGKESESDWLKKLGAKEIKLRSDLDLSEDQAAGQGHLGRRGGQPRRAGAGVDGEHHEGQRRHRRRRPGAERRAAHLGDAVHPARRQPARHQLGRQLERTSAKRSGRRLASDLKPPLLKEMARTIPFAELPGVFDDFINAKINRRIVVDLSE